MHVVRKDPHTGYLDNLLWVPKAHVNVEGTKSALSFSVMDKKQMRFLCLYKETEHHLLVPREFWKVEDLDFPVVDLRPTSYAKTGVTSRITLDFKNPKLTTQRDSVKAMRESLGGVLQLACGLGKSICALELIAQEQVPALIVIDNTQLLEQWTTLIQEFLEVPGGMGRIQGPVFDWQKAIVMTTYQTLALRAADFPEEARRWFGLIIGDECHHLSAPTWARAADLFPGKRIGLTATPTRADGMHVIYDLHVGPVLYKNLSQELRPDIYFYWTGLQVDLSDEETRKRACDVNGELHTGLLYGHFGQWRERLDLILTEVRKAAAQGRKILVLSYSIDELMNLLTLWNGEEDTYTSIPMPTPEDVNETVLPQVLDPRGYKRVNTKLAEVRRHIRDPRVEPLVRQKLEMQRADLEHRLKAHDVATKIRLEYERRQRAYIKETLAKESTAGLMIGSVKPKERQRMLKEKQVTFAIMKYGREGLDEPSLDTVFVCEPMSQRNALQQLLGRILRKKDGKRKPVAVFFEDDVGPIIGMCQNLRRHLRTWSADEGGPFTYTLVGHPRKGKAAPDWRDA